MKKVMVGAGVAVVLLTVYWFFGDAKTSTPVASNPSPSRSYVAAEGKVEAMPGFDVDLGTSELNGRIAKIMVREGDPVSRGQVVAVLENDDLQAQVAQGEQQLTVTKSQLAELESGARPEEIRAAAAALEGASARMDEANKQWTRDRELLERRMISPSVLDASEASFKAAQSAVKEARQRKKLLEEGPKAETVQLYRDQVKLAEAALEYARKRLEKTIVRSPIDGTVIERYLDEGEGLTPEIPIVAIADLSKVWVNAEVDETDLGKIKVGNPVQIHSNAFPGLTIKGTIREIAHYVGARAIRPSNPAVNLGVKVVQVKMQIPEQTPLRLGMTVDVRIEVGGE